jgi:hypothetical protein
MWRDRVWRGRAGQAFQFDEPGFPTANDQISNDSGPRLLMSQWPNSRDAQNR